MMHYVDPRENITACGLRSVPKGEKFTRFETYKVDCPKCLKMCGSWYCEKCAVAVKNNVRCKVCGKTEQEER